MSESTQAAILNYEERAFNRAEDFSKFQRFLAEMRRQVAQAAYFQWGDLLWRMHFPPNGFDESRDIRIWSGRAGEIYGFVFYLPPDDNPEFFLRPELYNSRIADEMVAWAVARARTGNAAFIETSCLAHDTLKAEYLRRGGFQPLDDVMVFMERNLATALPVCQLPHGYSIVSAIERPELAGITGENLTPALYVNVCNALGYKDDLGLRVCYQNQEIVAGCICWHDEVDNCGELEPVGTDTAHRGQGLAYAVVAKTLNNLKRYGADMAYVRTDKENAPAVRLYQKLGFTITHEDVGCQRPI